MFDDADIFLVLLLFFSIFLQLFFEHKKREPFVFYFYGTRVDACPCATLKLLHFFFNETMLSHGCSRMCSERAINFAQSSLANILPTISEKGVKPPKLFSFIFLWIL